MMRVLVCGGRKFGWHLVDDDETRWKEVKREREFVENKLSEFNSIHPFSLLIDGDATGVDRIANSWAYKEHIPRQSYPPDWIEGPAAGPMRNQKMLDEGKPDVVIAFPGGAGTADMKTKARKAGVPVIEVQYDGS